MKLNSLLKCAALAMVPVFVALPGFAADIMINDAYARAASPSAKAGATFMEIINHSDADDRLIGARSDAARVTELHTHIDAGNGVMQMRHVEAGFEIPAGGTHMLMRGGDHVMLMGLTRSFVHGETIELTLVFENAGEMTIEVPIDLERSAETGGMSHGTMSHGTDNN